ncbi:DNA cytosine methyltransferase [Chryseobacterium salivictor]|uniref:Cytosine-specific methyltransferase n=1 Tax=Chryseobacterium salivictor TaxID=2547600 RepID=A0A4P6ZHW8_9FLAO|nr:DNA cytosine methyltransferase [Chryseobacterium salivictor]QBO59351.1 Modification methylase AplI [Chryseobacterium salivictor]
MIKEKKIKVVDLFAGAGGFGLGFKLAKCNYELLLSLEVDKWAVDTLKANSNHTIIHNDIKKYNTAGKIKEICPEKPDVIIGGPPCQGFSNAGKKDPSDPRNSLFKSYAEWVEVLEPKIFVMENVKGILTGKNERGEKVIDIIRQTFEKIGYRVNIWELNAANYGVPQSRERVFIVGNKFNTDISIPPITHYFHYEKAKLNGKAQNLLEAITVIDAIGDLPELNAGEGSEEDIYTKEGSSTFQRISKGSNNILFNHVSMRHTSRVVKRYERIMDGESLFDMPEDLMVRKRNGNGELSQVLFSSNYRHLKPNMISYTIPASFYSNFIHPTQPRNITSREAARLQSFPDNYVFKGKRTQISSKLLTKLGKDSENHLSQYNQIGNAVPPLLAKAIARHLHSYLNNNFGILT